MSSRDPQIGSPEVLALFDGFLTELRARLEDPSCDRRILCRDFLMKLYFGDQADYGAMLSDPDLSLASRSMVASMDPQNITLEPEYYGEMDVERYYRAKPLLWLWQMFDHAPAGQNLHLGLQVRALLARHIFRRLGENVRFFRGVEFSFGYNMSVGSNVTFHRFVLVDDRGPVEIEDNVSLSDWSNVYTHTHDVEDIGDVTVRPTILEEGVRLAYHSTVLAGTRMSRDSMLGSMAVATRDVPPHHVSVGVPAKPMLVKKTAQQDRDYLGPYEVKRPKR